MIFEPLYDCCQLKKAALTIASIAGNFRTRYAPKSYKDKYRLMSAVFKQLIFNRRSPRL